MKRVTLVAVALAVVTVSLSYYFETKAKKAEAEFLEKNQKLQKYLYLKSKWDKKALRKELKKIDDMIEIYSLSCEKKRKNSKLVYTLKVPSKVADEVVSYIVNANILMKSFFVKKISDREIEVEFRVVDS